MNYGRALGICLAAASGICAGAEPVMPGATCSVEQVGQKVLALQGTPGKAELRKIKQECKWAVDASSCTFNHVIQMFLERKTSAEVRSQCMR